MRPLLLILFIAAVLAAGFAPAPFPPRRLKATLATMQGTWFVASCKADGAVVTGSCSNSEGLSVVRGAPIVITGNRATFWIHNRIFDDWTICVNAAPRTTTIDLDGVKRRLRVLGICQLRGDTLTLCISDRGLDRPAGFDGDRNGHTLLILTRSEP
jgi:uncharacterized protein (TIGR03067 family)